MKAKKKKTPPIPVAIRINRKYGDAMLFYYDDYGEMVCFDLLEGHGYCCYEYYRSDCYAPKTPEEIKEADDLFRRYEMIDTWLPLQRVKRLQRKEPTLCHLV